LSLQVVAQAVKITAAAGEAEQVAIDHLYQDNHQAVAVQPSQH
jgi:hypothetical protein